MAVSIRVFENHLLLRSGHAELLVTPEHLENLSATEDKRAFARYFLEQALVNRPARKLFKSWLRKDGELWTKVYLAIMREKNKQQMEQAEPADAKPDTETS